MKHLWIAAIAMALVPALAHADHRFDSRYNFDRGSRYHHGSHSSFGFSIGVGSSYGYCAPSYSRYDSCGYAPYAPVYRETRVYAPAVYAPPVVYDARSCDAGYYYSPAPAVIYAPPPRVYYYEPVTVYPAPSYYSQFRFHYRR